MRKVVLVALFVALVAGCATTSNEPAPNITVNATPAHVRDVVVALMTTAAVKTGESLRLKQATRYSVVFDGPPGSGSWLTPSGYAEVDITLAPEGSATLVVARSYNVAPQGNIMTGSKMRAETTGANAAKFLVPLLNAVKRCAVGNPPPHCPGSE